MGDSAGTMLSNTHDYKVQHWTVCKKKSLKHDFYRGYGKQPMHVCEIRNHPHMIDKSMTHAFVERSRKRTRKRPKEITSKKQAPNGDREKNQSASHRP